MSIATTQLTPDFLQALIQWQDKGNRSVKIEIDRRIYNGDTAVDVFVMDYKYVEGAYVESTDDLPTTEQLLQKKRERLAKEQKQLEEGVF